MRRIRIIVCEVRWLFFSLITLVRLAGKDKLHNPAMAKSNMLRKLLRGTPWWAAGHLRLARLELEAGQDNTKDKLGHINAARASALAASLLSQNCARVKEQAQQLLFAVEQLQK